MPSANVMRSDIAPAIGRAISHYPAKILARAARSSERAAKSWKSGHRAPRAEELIALMREFDEVYEAVLHVAGRAPAAALTEIQRRALTDALKTLTEDSP